MTLPTGKRTVGGLLTLKLEGYESDGYRWRRGPGQPIARPSHLVTGVWYSVDRVFDTEIGGVRKVTSGPGDVNPTTGVDLRAGDTECCGRGHDWRGRGHFTFSVPGGTSGE